MRFSVLDTIPTTVFPQASPCPLLASEYTRNWRPYAEMGEEVLHPTMVTLRESLQTLKLKKVYYYPLSFYFFVIMKEYTPVTNSNAEMHSCKGRRSSQNPSHSQPAPKIGTFETFWVQC